MHACNTKASLPQEHGAAAPRPQSRPIRPLKEENAQLRSTPGQTGDPGGRDLLEGVGWGRGWVEARKEYGRGGWGRFQLHYLVIAERSAYGCFTVILARSDRLPRRRAVAQRSTAVAAGGSRQLAVAAITCLSPCPGRRLACLHEYFRRCLFGRRLRRC